MSPLKITIHRTGNGTCSLSNKADCDGLTVTFDDGTVTEQHLSWKSFHQLVAMKTAHAAPKPAPKAAAVAVAQPAPAPSTNNGK